MKYLSDYIDYLKGKKSYILGLFAVLYGVSGYYIGQLDSNTALQFVWGGLTAMAIRAATFSCQ